MLLNPTLLVNDSLPPPPPALSLPKPKHRTAQWSSQRLFVSIHYFISAIKGAPFTRILMLEPTRYAEGWKRSRVWNTVMHRAVLCFIGSRWRKLQSNGMNRAKVLSSQIRKNDSPGAIIW